MAPYYVGNQFEKSPSNNSRKYWTLFNIFLLLGLIIFLIIMVWKVSVNPETTETVECIDVNKVASLVFDTCYDAYTKNIFLSVKRGFDNYHMTGFEFSFFDLNQQLYEIGDVPEVNGSKAFKIPAEKNPQNLKLRLDIVKDFSAPICDEPRSLFVKYCPPSVNPENVNASLSPLEGVDIDEFEDVVTPHYQESDVLSTNLVEKERIWETKCVSDWACSSWEACEDGVQKRTCRDLKNCFIPTRVPDEVRYCQGYCEEKWECTWSKCSNGYTIPQCTDLNRCGTTYTIPQKLECESNRKCVPEMQCGEWSSCEVNYNFVDLTGGSISDLQGTKSRTCVDSKGCLEGREETRSCSVEVDVYTRRFNKCGTEFVGVYNRLTNDLIARIDPGSKEAPSLNVFLDNGADSQYCDYCFDGVLDGDEEGIDCGGSCESCVDKHSSVELRDNGFLKKLGNFIKRLLV